jgi:Pyruvate/2-oxoacid:ferredoxin oxidoreductase delta subunit
MLESSMRLIVFFVKPSSPASYSCAAWHVATLAISAMIPVMCFNCSVFCLVV